MSTDPQLAHALDLLARGHRLYVGPEPAAPPMPDHGPPGAPPAGVPARAAAELATTLHRISRADRELAALLARAHTARSVGRHATGRILDDAHADTAPGADTAIGRREALRRMAARLHSQRHHIHRSRRGARALTRRMRRLRYPSSHAIPLTRVRYHRRHPSGAVRGRILAALDRLGITDPRARQRWLRGYQTLIARESGGDPTAIAGQPAAALGPVQPDGHPLGYARGLTQTLPQTFARYHQPGTATDIYDPVANICASMNYVMHRYGVRVDAANLTTAVQQADAGRPAKGY